MAWVVDTSVLIDIAENDPLFGQASARLLDLKSSQGLTICPITYVELSPLFNGDQIAQRFFLDGLRIDWQAGWSLLDTAAAHLSWNVYIQSKRAGLVGKRPIADLLIGAFAMRFDGLLTRNEADFQKLFPKLQIAAPGPVVS